MNYKKDFVQSTKSFVAKNRQMIFFILRVAIIYVLWKLLIWFLGEESTPLSERHWPWLSAGWEQFNDWVRIFLLYSTKFVYYIFGYDIYVIINYRLIVLGFAWFDMGNYCLGIQLWIYFVALICSYPGKWKRKLLYSAIGIISINILNILRFVFVLYAYHTWPNHMNFNQDLVFNVIVYIFTFLMWILMVKRDEGRVR